MATAGKTTGIPEKDGAAKTAGKTTGIQEENSATETAVFRDKAEDAAVVHEQEQVAAWRIEIFRQKSPKGGYRLYWLWRITLRNGRRPSKYGGTIATLPFPERLTQYRRNSRRYAKRRATT